MTRPVVPLPMTRIVVAVDESPCARQALRWAAALGASTGARVEAVHVYPRDLAWIDRDQRAEELEYSRQSATTAGLQLLTMVTGEELDDSSRVTPVVLLGDAAARLTAYADGADLLVVGTHGRGSLASLVLGSVSQHCVEHASCAVAVVPPGITWSAATTAEPAAVAGDRAG
jgi:nucleotide-binding universal stress UspA family protein